MSEGRKFLRSEPMRVGIFSGGDAGVPSVKTRWQPIPRAGLARATATACSNAGPVAMSVAEVRTPAW